MTKKIKAPSIEIPWTRYEIVLRDGVYYYYITENSTRRLLMTASRDVTKDE